MSRHLLRKLYNLTVYSIGGLVLLAATLATLVRMLLPDIGMYRAEIEGWVSNYMDLPVVMRTLNAGWQGWTPSLHLEDIELLNRDGTTPLIRFARASLSIDLLRSLRERQIMPRQLVIGGFDLAVTRYPDGSIGIQGVRVEESGQPGAGGGNELARWLLSQPHIELQEANIAWTDYQHRQSPLSLANVNLELRSDADRLQIDGSTVLGEPYGQSFRFAMDIQGDLLSSGWAGEMFVEATGVHPGSWYPEYWPGELGASAGTADMSVWSRWEAAAMTSLDGVLDTRDLALTISNNALPEILSLQSHFSGQQLDHGGWGFNLAIPRLETRTGPWRETRLQLEIGPADAQGHSDLITAWDYLNIDDLAAVATAMPGIPTAAKNILSHLRPGGTLVEGRLGIRGGATPTVALTLDSRFDGLGFQSAVQPGIASLSGRIQIDGTRGRVVFDQDTLMLDPASATGDTLPSLGVTGVANWQRRDDGTTIDVTGMTLANADLEAQLGGVISLQDEGPHANLMLRVESPDITRAVSYMPWSESFRAREWISRSITAGHLQGLDILLRGPLQEFPFDRQQGYFRTYGTLEQARLDYHPDYPAIDDITASLSLQGRGLQVDVYQGRVHDATAHDVTAVIPDLWQRQKLLTINGHISGQTSDLRHYIRHSPLGTDALLAGVNESLQDQGQMELDLTLRIPMRIPDRKLEVEGRLGLTGARVIGEVSSLTLDDLDGEVVFSRDSVNGEGINARLGDHPVNLSIRANPAREEPTRLTIHGRGNPDYLAGQVQTYMRGSERLADLLRTRLSGETGWEASLLYFRDSPDSFPRRELLISSDLVGLSLNLPAPLEKSADSAIPLEIRRTLDRTATPRLSVRYGKLIDAALTFVGEDGNRLDQALILFGEGAEPVAGGSGIRLAGHLDRLALQEWLRLLGSGDPAAGQTSTLPVHADIRLDELEYAGQSFRDMHFVADNSGHDWLLTLVADRIAGEIRYTGGDSQTRRISARLGHLMLELPAHGQGGGINLNPEDIPGIDAVVEKFLFAGLDLGRLELKATATDAGLAVDTIELGKPDLTIGASGTWMKNRYTDSASRFTIHAEAAEFPLLLSTFGFNSNNFARGSTRIEVDAEWPGGPTDFSLARLNGTLKLDMGKGQMLNISPAAGRLFGLLSLQTLPRRLVLDFTDLFGEGMAFDSIRGSFLIKDGNAYTDDLTLKGPAVDVEMNGRTGLATRDYDQTAVIIPQISDSLAVASGFLGPVGVGLGTVLYLAGNIFQPLQDSINSIMKIEYGISGSWDEPVVEPIKHKQVP